MEMLLQINTGSHMKKMGKWLYVQTLDNWQPVKIDFENVTTA